MKSDFYREDIGLVSTELLREAAGALTVPEDQAHFYAEGVRRGGTLVTVNAKHDALAMHAVDILKRHGAIDLDERAREWMQQGWSRRYQETQPEPAKPLQSQQAATASQRPAQAARGPAGEQSSFPAAQAHGAQPVEAQGTTHDAGQRSAGDQPAVAVSAVEVYSFTLEPGPERRQAA